MNFSDWLLALEAYPKIHNPKLVILLGGPAVGKSYVANLFVKYGYRTAILDQYFEAMMRKIQGQDKVNVSIKDPLQKQKYVQAAIKNDERIDYYIKNGYPIVTEKTGQNFGTIAQLKRISEAGGYTCFAIYDQTDVELAVNRNKNRPKRSLSDEEELRNTHAQVASNMFPNNKGAGLSSLFGDHFYVVNGDGTNNQQIMKVVEEINEI